MLQSTNISRQQLVNTQLFYAKSLYNLASKMTVFDSLFFLKKKKTWIYDKSLAPQIQIN